MLQSGAGDQWYRIPITCSRPSLVFQHNVHKGTHNVIMFKELGLPVAWFLHTMKNVNLVAEGNLRYLQILGMWSTKLQITDGPKKNHKLSG